MTTEPGVSKEEEEEEDDTMQNTVVLFSNTDKFVLLQVSNSTLIVSCHWTRYHWIGSVNSWMAFSLSLSVGHVCGVRQLWQGHGGPTAGLCSVCPVLPSILRQQQGKPPVTATNALYLREIKCIHLQILLIYVLPIVFVYAFIWKGTVYIDKQFPRKL